MKKIILVLAVVLSSHLMADENSSQKELLRDIKTLTKKCIVQIVSTNEAFQNATVVGYKSYCSTLRILSPLEAQIFIDNEWLTATIKDSDDSDGGDLDDLTIMNAEGQTLVTKTNIASFNSVLAAMAGDTDFKKLYVK